ncbi:hypothetical protein ACJJIX_05325 [Microbulbifer sp. VAAC004]|uniref:hypothetical protein n=1 Tax=unclassified Microbulbifer TaxID=2619833 RepID=UPI00403A2F8F
MTKSESLLEDILKKFGIAFERIPESNVPNKKTPNYLVPLGDIDSYWEVKELEPNEDEEAISKIFEAGKGEVYSVNSRRIRNSIKSACEQFKNYKVTDSPCVIVLYDARPFATKDLLFYPELKTAMLGRAEFIAKHNGEIKEISRKGALLKKNGKTYVSAIVVIHDHAKEAVVLHNPNAKIPLLESSLKRSLNHHEVANFTENCIAWKKV